MKIKGSSIPLLTFITGFCSIILQSVIIRELLVASFGNKLSIALVFAGFVNVLSVVLWFIRRNDNEFLLNDNIVARNQT